MRVALRLVALRLLLVVLLVASQPAIALAAEPSVATAASGDLWAKIVADPTGVTTHIELGPDGTHHLAVVNAPYDATIYATDAGNRWQTTTLPGRPLDMTLDAAGHVFILSGGSNDATPDAWLTTDLAGSLVTEVIPGSGYTYYGALAVDGAGVVHTATAPERTAPITYLTRTGGTWSAPRTLDDQLLVYALDLVVDSDAVPHVLASGGYGGTTRPAGCEDLPQCTFEITVGASPVLTVIAPTRYTSLSATVAGTTIDAVGTDDGRIVHFGSAGGTWASDTIETANIVWGSLVHGPNGLVAIYTDAQRTGVRRADWTGSGWDIALLDAPVDNAVGTVDAADRAHIAATYPYNHDDGGFLASLMLIAPDTMAPISAAPKVLVRRGATVGTTVPVTVSWSGTDALSGVGSFTLGQATNSTWSTVSSSLTSTSIVRALSPGSRAYAFRVRAKDRDGNVGGYAVMPAFRVGLGAESSTNLTYKGSWTTVSGSAYLGGKARYAKSTSASAKITVTAYGFAWVGTYCSTCGSAKIYVDGVLADTVSTYRTSRTGRVVIWAVRWPARTTHTVTIAPAGTAGHSRVDVDGYVVVQ